MSKFTPKCPDCGSVLKKAKKGYLCPSAKCKVIEVHFDRSLRVERIVREGLQAFDFGEKKRKD